MDVQLPAWVTILAGLGGLSGLAVLVRELFQRSTHKATAAKIDADGAEVIAESARKLMEFSESRIDGLQQDVDKMRADYMATMAQLIETQKKMADKEHENGKLKKELEESNNEKRELIMKMEKMDKAMAVLEEQNKRLLMSVAQLTCRVQELEARS
ncbi:MAG: hypothetical protein KBA03_03730 [Anaerolineaceae bacterium]|nr:hypothetical protein [Anaerolineaceae bacterium]